MFSEETSYEKIGEQDQYYKDKNKWAIALTTPLPVGTTAINTYSGRVELCQSGPRGRGPGCSAHSGRFVNM